MKNTLPYSHLTDNSVIKTDLTEINRITAVIFYK